MATTESQQIDRRGRRATASAGQLGRKGLQMANGMDRREEGSPKAAAADPAGGPDAPAAGGGIKFGLVYEICRPEPFDGFMSETEAYWQALEQVALADELGFDYVWEVEHHFLEGYSISSAPEVFLSAVAQHTKRIRVG